MRILILGALLTLAGRSHALDTGNATIAANVVGSIPIANGGTGSATAASALTALGTVAFSSAPVSHVGGNSLIGTLVSGTTFFSFVPDSAVTLRRLTLNVIVAGISGSGDTVTCNNAAGTGISATATAAAVSGTVVSTPGTANIAYQGQVFCHMDSTAATRPIVNAVLEYITQ